MANNLAIIQKDITDTINVKVAELRNGGLALPKNYNYSNALKSAFFALQEVKDKSGKPVLETCTKESIANTLLDMVTQGLSPAKTQCYFIAYGDKLQMQRSYFGTQAVLKRLGNVKDIWANVIFEGDTFDYKIKDGRERLVRHDTNFLNRDNKILGAYAVIKTNDNDEVITVMTIKEIETAWSQSRGGQAVHKKFPQEMAKRTVINRAAKAYINTSDDSDLLIEAINRTTENEYDNEPNTIKDVTETVQANANKEVLDFPKPPKQEPIEAEIVEDEPVQEAEQVNLLDPGF